MTCIISQPLASLPLSASFLLTVVFLFSFAFLVLVRTLYTFKLTLFLFLQELSLLEPFTALIAKASSLVNPFAKDYH